VVAGRVGNSLRSLVLLRDVDEVLGLRQRHDATSSD